MSRFWPRLAALLCLVMGAAQAGQATVAVAANFSAPMQQLRSAFERHEPHRLKLVAGSTGGLYAQILHGAPYAVFLAADQKRPQALVKAGLAVRGSRFTYARGQLVLWSAHPGALHDAEQTLRRGNFRHLAIANPRLAPYGLAAMQTLQALGVASALQGKLVLGESIAQAQQFVVSGNAELGLLAASQVVHDSQPGSGSIWWVPKHLYQPIRQDVVLLKHGENNAAATALLHFLRSSEARHIMAAYGYLAD